MRTRLALILAVVACTGFARRSQTQATLAHRFQQIAPGVYSAVATGSLNLGSNAAVIVNKDDVVVVDSHISPEAGRALLNEVKTLTDKPVRFLVNTHFHYDHASGNQVFAPVADVIGHEYTRRRLAGDILERGMFADLLRNLPRQIEETRARAAAEQDPAARTRLEQQVKNQLALAPQIRETKPTPPNVTLSERMTLVRGDREIQLIYLGHGHTGGDVVVHLPQEKLVATGDLLVNGIPNLIDGFVNEWPDALEKLKAVDFVDVIPGHGEPFKGKERIDWLQAYLRDLWKQATALHADKVSAADAAKRIDMTAHKAHYATITGPGVNPLWVVRIYEVIERRAN